MSSPASSINYRRKQWKLKKGSAMTMIKRRDLDEQPTKFKDIIVVQYKPVKDHMALKDH